MSRKKILITNLFSLFPKTMANQDRIFQLIRRLALDHEVHVLTPWRDQMELKESRSQLKPVCHQFIPIRAVNPRNAQLRRKYHRLRYYLRNCLYGDPENFYYAHQRSYHDAISQLVKENNYHAVQAEYWFMATGFDRLPTNVHKVIDTHDVLHDKRRQELARRFGDKLPARAAREVARYRELEWGTLSKADMLIAISEFDDAALATVPSRPKTLLVPSGQNIDYFHQAARTEPSENVVTFYGSMGGEQNIDAFWRLWNSIFPRIQAQVPDVKLLVVGANPPESIKRLEDGNTLIVTGFVDDVRPWLARAKVMMIPLDVAAGFRSRVVDAMSMCIPIVGTHKALDSVGMENGKHGFITDDDSAMAGAAVRILRDGALRARLGAQSYAFVRDRYSIDATFGELSRYYADL